MTERLTRRSVLMGAGKAIVAGLLIAAGHDGEGHNTEMDKWPTDKEKILTRIEAQVHPPGSEARTTVLLRKEMWEIAQVLKLKGQWQEGEDESAWQNHLDIVEANIVALKEIGFKGVRLAILPFEIINEEKQYDWTPIETAMDLFAKHGLKVDLCLGPLDYPYGPDGIRLPKYLQNQLNDYFTKEQVNYIYIPGEESSAFPPVTEEIRKHAFSFLEKLLAKYGNDPRVDKFCLGNEWPDPHKIEGVNGVMMLSPEFMLKLVKMAIKITDKEIVLNTNIHVSKIREIETHFGDILNALGSQGVLGIDAYPTQEAKSLWLSLKNASYGDHIEKLRKRFPKTKLIFTEFQYEPWPKKGVAGDSWAKIFKEHPEVVEEFYEELFPLMTESHLLPSGIKEIGLWGSATINVLAQMGYEFPKEIVKAMTRAMSKS